MFHVPEAMTSKTLRSCRNSVLTTFLSILLPFVLPFKLRRTRLPVVLIEVPPVGILHKLIELSSDVGFHIGIFIIRGLISFITFGLQSMLLLLLSFPILVKPNS